VNHFQPSIDESQRGAIQTLVALLETRTGQQIAPNRFWRVETALKPMLRERGWARLDQVVDLLANDSDDQLATSVVDALLNQETSFFRDSGAIETLLDVVADMQPQRRARIWSAACSTGQEPLSIAMLFAERAAKTGLPEPEIVATDVSPAALSRARSGVYTQFEIQRGLAVRRMIDWFEAVGPDWIALPQLVRKISYRRHNLVTDEPPMGPFDVVLCRNVLLYLSADLRRRVFERLAQALRPGGLLMLGAGETAIGQTDRFIPSTRFKGLYESLGPR